MSEPPTPASDGSASFDTTGSLIEEFKHLPFGEGFDGQSTRLADIYSELHRLSDDRKPIALCLSGGGIRSATFCLGVLQAFAQSERLRAFHYLSTVSGGGYIGSWLSNWLRIENWDWTLVLRKLADGDVPNTGARPVGGTEESAHDPVSRLRAYSNYLSPVWGWSTDALGLVAIFLRNLLLNWLVWLPLLAAAVAVPRLYVALVALQFAQPMTNIVLALTVLSALLVVIGIGYVVADLPGDRTAPGGGTLNTPQGVQSRFAICCFLPVAGAAVVFSIVGAWAAPFRSTVELWHFLCGGVVAHLLGVGLGIVWRHIRNLPVRRGGRDLFGATMVLASGAVGGWLLWLALTYAGPSPDVTGDDFLLYSTISVPVMLGCFWLAMTLYTGFVGRVTTEDDREWWSRATAWWLYASLVWMAAFALVIYLLPWLFDELGSRVPTGTQLGVGGTALGVLTSAIGYWSKNGTDLKKRTEGFLQATGLRLLDLMAGVVIVLALLGSSLVMGWLLEHCHSVIPSVCVVDMHSQISYVRGEAMLTNLRVDKDKEATRDDERRVPRSADARVYEHVLLHADSSVVGYVIGALLAAALLLSWLIGANTFSLHGMYGNRLVRAYLGAGRYRRRPHWFTGFDPEDNCPLTDFRQDGVAVSDRRLFPVINIALNLVRPADRRLAWQQRKAGSFTATPLRCGADGVGFVPTPGYGDVRGMSIGRALTISGAAASPNMGYHSSGLVTFVMTLFNVRLGWWLPNPGSRWFRDWQRSSPSMGFWALLNEAFGRTTDDRASIYLSDGGHFENLGLYEMVRRRCHRIVVVDASCDPDFSYADLHDAVRKIRVDFGIPIELPTVLPGPGRTTAHPRRVVGRIRYSARDGNAPESDGYLYLIKPRLVGDEAPDIGQYAAASRREGNAFPHQTTADQFFDETQFESYRLLGLESAKAAFTGESHDWPSADARAALPQPTQAANDGKPGAVGGLAGMVQDFGAGAALAAAITVGGTLGVAGTVSMSPGEVKLSPEDRQLLKDGLNVKLSQGEIQLSKEDRALLAGGLAVRHSFDEEQMRRVSEPARLAVEDLRVAARRLIEAADRLQRPGGGSTGPADPDLLRTIRELNVTIADLTRQLPSKAGVEVAIKSVTDKVEAVRVAVSRLGTGADPNLTSLLEELRLIRGAVDNVKQSVDESAPRRNVRGQEGGSR